MWGKMPGGIGKYIVICLDIEGGWRSPETEWPELQDRMIETVMRLESALKAPVLAISI